MSDFDHIDRAIGQAIQKAGAHRMYPCRHCDASIYFVDRVAYGEDDREHRCMTTTAQKRYQCFRCHAQIKFDQRRPYDMDGTPHACSQRGQPRVDPNTGEIFSPTGVA